MINPPNIQRSEGELRRAQIARQFAGAAGVSAIIVGVLVLFGWALDIAVLKSVLPGLVTMKANTALGFILAGTALWLLRRESASAFARRMACTCAGVTTLTGLLTLLEYALGVNLGIDQWLFIEPMPGDARLASGRMAPISAGSFLLLGTALLLLDRRGIERFVPIYTFTVLGFALLALMGYLYGVGAFYQVGSVMPMAVHTAAAFALLATGLICARPDRGLAALFISDTTGGVTARRLLPAALLVPVLLGWIRLAGQRQAYYDTEFGVALYTFSTSAILFLLGWWISLKLDQSDRERAQAETAIRESEQRYRQLVHSLDVAIYTTDAQGRITLCNEAAARLWGCTPELGKDRWCGFWKIFEPNGNPLRLEQCPMAMAVLKNQSVRGREILVERPDGTRRNVLPHPHPIRDASGAVIGGVNMLVDITDRKEAEEELAASVERLRLALDAADLGTWDWDFATGRIEWGGHHARLLGLAHGEFDGSYAAFERCVHPEDRQGIREAVEAARKTRVPYRREYRVIWPDGTIHWILGQGEFLFDANGLPTRMLGAILDISARKFLEERVSRLNEELEERVRQRTEELEAANKELESFSYSVSHDLRAPVRAMIGFGRVLQMEHAGRLDAEGLRVLGVIDSEARRMGRLIDDLLEFSRLGRQELRKEAIPMMALVSRALAALHAEQAGREVELVVGELPPGHGDSALLEQVWVNLLSNALKYSRHQPKARIAIGSRLDSGETAYFVQDNGVGFDMRHAGKLFGVFQRLHAESEFEGTGVGLALVQRIIHRHGGRVWAEAKLNEGATLYFTLPARKEGHHE